MKLYQGIFKPLNKNKYRGDVTNIVFRSRWEYMCFRWCDENSKVKSWSSEEVVIPYFYDVDKKYHRYYVDLKITFTSGDTIIVEIKPDKETKPPNYPGKKTKRYLQEGMTYVKNMNKWKAAENYAKDRGWGFQIWTENTLADMGLMPKKLNTIKKIKPITSVKSKRPKRPL